MEKSWLTLLIMAAWMWSRYGWLKQIDWFGPHGETILEYSVYDAIKAWFDHVVLVIRESFYEQFKEVLGSRFDDKIKVTYVFQEINPTVEWFNLIHREKPRGTGHAVLAAKEVIDGNFCVINADDYYGVDAYTQMGEYLTDRCTPNTCSMVGYILKNTLSGNWSVNRWICHLREDWTLDDVHERIKLEQDSPTTVVNPNWDNLPIESITSLNFRWFNASFFDHLEKEFHVFLKEHGQEETYEFFLPSAINSYIHLPWNSCEVMVSHDKRHGVSYANDKPVVQNAIQVLVSEWTYPSPIREG